MHFYVTQTGEKTAFLSPNKLALSYELCVSYNIADYTVHHYVLHMHTWQPIVFIQPGVHDMSIIICAYRVAIK